MKKNKLVYGVGINDADYVVKVTQVIGYDGAKRKQKTTWVCPYWRKWSNMLMRCYSIKQQERQPTYRGCTVCEEWLIFSNFKRWMEKQNWEGKQLDKDILQRGNKIYCPELCVLVDVKINNFLLDRAKSRGLYPIGCSWSPDHKKFRASCQDARGRHMVLGLFDTELEAHKAWLAFKLEQAKILAAEQTDPRVAKALIERYKNYVIEENSLV